MTDRDRIEEELIGEADDCDALCGQLEEWIASKAPLYRQNDSAGYFFATLHEVIGEQRWQNQSLRDNAGQTALDTERDARREEREE